MKLYHPDLVQDEDEQRKRNEICQEINAEYDALMKKMTPLIIKKDDPTLKVNTMYEKIVNGSATAKNAYDDIMINISKPNIEYKYYYSNKETAWWEEDIVRVIDETNSLFWKTCYEKGIVGEEFSNLYELCNRNAEKIKRTVMFLSTGAIPENIIHENLLSHYMIPFFNDDIFVEDLPDYNSFLLLSKENTRPETFLAWINFYQQQRDDFLNRYNDIVVKKIPQSRAK